MSSPFGHSLAGLIIAGSRNQSLLPKDYLAATLCICIANAPDLDFIPGIIVGKPNLFHHEISHSLGAAVIFSVILSILLKRIPRESLQLRLFLVFFLYSSHILLDLISYDGRPPFGIPLFWPLSQHHFMIPILPSVKHSQLDHATIGQFFTDVFSVHNLYVLGLETLLVIPFVLVCLLFLKDTVNHP